MQCFEEKQIGYKNSSVSLRLLSNKTCSDMPFSSINRKKQDQDMPRNDTKNEIRCLQPIYTHVEYE